MPGRRFRLATFGGLFVLIELLAVVLYSTRPADPEFSATRLAEPVKKPRFVSELSPTGLLKSDGLPDAMRIAASKARGLFRSVPWDEFVVTAERAGGPNSWSVRIEQKSGERDDLM